MTKIYHIQDEQAFLRPAPKGDIFWMLDADKEIIKEARQWFKDVYNLQVYEQHWAKGEDDCPKPAYWVIDDKEIAMAFKMRWC